MPSASSIWIVCGSQHTIHFQAWIDIVCGLGDELADEGFSLSWSTETGVQLTPSDGTPAEGHKNYSYVLDLLADENIGPRDPPEYEQGHFVIFRVGVQDMGTKKTEPKKPKKKKPDQRASRSSRSSRSSKA